MTTGHDLRMVVPAACAWLGAWVGTGGLGRGWLGAVIAALVLVAVWAWCSHRHVVVVAAAVLVLIGGAATARAQALHGDVPARLATDGAVASLTVEVVGDPTAYSDGEVVVARATLVDLAARGMAWRASQPVRLLATGDSTGDLLDLEPGGTYSVSGRMAPADPDDPEALVLRVRRVPTALAPPSGLDRFVTSLRGGLRTASVGLSPERAALVPSLVVGDTAGISAEMTEDFRATGLSHLLAVSGSNLILFLGLALVLARHVGFRGWWVRAVALLGVALFVLVCRAEASVVRAAAMGTVALLATGMGRGSGSLRHLGIAVMAVFAIDPWLSRSWGFALSVAACAGIALWSRPWGRALGTWLPDWAGEALAVPLAAQVATEPLTVALSGRVSVVALVANMLAGPFVGPATILGLAATCLSWVGPLAPALAWLAGWCVQPILWIAHVGADMPTATFQWPAGGVGVGLSLASSLLLAALLPRILGARFVVVGLVAGMVAVAALRPFQLGWPGPWAVIFCDVGQGDATLIRAGPDAAMLVDTGPDGDSLAACLSSAGIRRVPLLVLTHYHADHIGGLGEILRSHSPEVILVSHLSEPAWTAEAVKEAAAAVGATVQVAEAGSVLRVGDATWTTVNSLVPATTALATEGESGAENDSSIIGVAESAGLRVLLAGDAEPDGQRAALRASDTLGLDLGVDVIKFPHHGSSRQEEDFFARSMAVLAVASAGIDNDYGHPAAKALRLAVDRGMTTARTDQQGAVAVWKEGGHLEVRTARTDGPS